MALYIFTLLLSIGLGLYLTPMAMAAARGLGMMARGDGGLRAQTEPVPYLGGMAVYIALLVALAVSVEFTPRMLGLLLGITIILMVGLIDDFGVMTARMKLFGQFLAAAALIKGGIVMELEIFKSVRLADLPLLSWALSVLWLAGMANAVNFLDVEDGLAGGTVAASCPALFAVAILNHRPEAALFTLALFGATLGFLRYNAPFPAARIYLGDAGALMLGMALAALAMIGSYTDKNDLAAVCPVLILGVPCFEMGVTMAARLRKGIPVWYGSPDHVSKRLMAAGLSRRAVLIMHWGASLVLGGVAVLVMRLDIDRAVWVVGAVAVVAIAAAVLILRIEVASPVPDGRKEDEAKDSS